MHDQFFLYIRKFHFLIDRKMMKENKKKLSVIYVMIIWLIFNEVSVFNETSVLKDKFE